MDDYTARARERFNRRLNTWRELFVARQDVEAFWSEVAAFAAEVAGEARQMVPLPDGVERYNGGTRCDMAVGPCACGAWHRSEAERATLQREVAALREENDALKIEAALNEQLALAQRALRELPKCKRSPHSNDQHRARCPRCNWQHKHAQALAAALATGTRDA